MKKLLCLILVVFMMIPLVVSCSKEEFEIESCGSGFYFNRSNKKEYKIKDLDAVSEGNYFYLDDYFCSESLGQEYTIKRGLFKVGSVFLAKKADHYNTEEYRFDIMEYNNEILPISPEMNYVTLYSSQPMASANLQIQIVSGRSTPLDLTLDNINIASEHSLPIIFSGASTDINLKLVGESKLKVSAQSYTWQDLVNRLKEQHWSDQEASYYAALEDIEKGKEAFTSGDGNEALDHFMAGLSDIGLGLVDSVIDSATGLIGGVDGVAGADGGIAIILYAGMSVSGDGSLTVQGGNGARGGDASASLIGLADGGDGGNGGDGIYCGAYLDMNGRVRAEGGLGAEGGSASAGLFGSSGGDGDHGSDGKSVNVANPRQLED